MANLLGDIFGGDMAGSIAQGMKLGMIQQQMQREKQQFEQETALNKLRTEEYGLKIQAQRTLNEESQKTRANWERLTKRGTFTTEIPGGDTATGYENNAAISWPTGTQTLTEETPSPLQMALGGQMSDLVVGGGPDLLKAVLPKMVENKDPASLRAFEMAYGLNPSLRGSEDYINKYERTKVIAPMVYGEIRKEIAELPRPTTTPGVTYSPKYGYQSHSGTGEKTPLSTKEVQDANIDFNAIKKNVMTYNGPTFVRLVNNAEILAKGTRNPYTGKMGKPELDQLVELRNQIDDGVFASISNKVKKFNDWDQFLKYQVSDPKMAAFKSKLMANVDTLANIYAGGGTVTSDFKMRFAQDLFDAGLSKGAFKVKMDTHKESVLDRAYKFSQPNARGYTTDLGFENAKEFDNSYTADDLAPGFATKLANEGKSDKQITQIMKDIVNRGRPVGDYTVGGSYKGKRIIGINRTTRQLNIEGLGVVPY